MKLLTPIKSSDVMKPENIKNNENVPFEKWYVLYHNRENFEILNKFYSKLNWGYYEDGGYHYPDRYGNHWCRSSEAYYSAKELEKEGYVQISFEDWKMWVVDGITEPKINESYEIF